MDEYNKIKKAFLISLLTASLVSFGFSAPLVFAAAEATSTPDTEIGGGTASTTPESEISGGTSSTTPAEPAVVETGDAVSQTQADNEINTNITDTAAAATTTIENENSADIKNNATTTADTGNNEANNNGSGGAAINTGNAYATANIVNVANTNILNSEGMLLFLNNFFGSLGTVDLRRLNLGFFGLSGGTSPESQNSEDQTTNDGSEGCSLSECGGSETVNNTNTASITNNVVVRSSTGGNTANGNAGGADINTGNAYAAANVVNVANTNISDSKYLVLVLNNFGDWNNDMVFPGKNFFSQLFSNNKNGTNGGGGIKVNNDNEADIKNNVSVSGDTGNNEANGNAGNSEINTGNAYAAANVENNVNTNVFGGIPFIVSFRIHGNWSGNVFSAPKGISWRQTPSGIQLFGGEEISEMLDDPSSTPRIHSTGDSSPEIGGPATEINNTNKAKITNNIKVLALTGDNRINGGGKASINTGNAYAAANVLNISNTNIIGRNWIWAIINIFGDWKGNIAFGRPDLWIGGRAEVDRDPVGPGSKITYHFTITNNGDADATGVSIIDKFDPKLLSFDGFNFGGGKAFWNIGTVAAGDTKDISYSATVDSNLAYGETDIDSTIKVESAETDNNEEDNTDFITVTAFRQQRRQMTGTRVILTPDPVLRITKTNDATDRLTASSTVDYKIIIKNSGGPAYHSVLFDTLRNEQGRIINRQSWNLDEIHNNEEITVNYSLFFNASTTPGTYTNYARVKAVGRHPSLDPFYGWFANSPVASSTIEIMEDKTPNIQNQSAQEPEGNEVVLTRMGQSIDMFSGRIRIIRKEIEKGVALGNLVPKLVKVPPVAPVQIKTAGNGRRGKNISLPPNRIFFEEMAPKPIKPKIKNFKSFSALSAGVGEIWPDTLMGFRDFVLDFINPPILRINVWGKIKPLLFSPLSRL